MNTPTRRVLLSLLCAIALVVLFSALALAQPLHFFSYPLVPGIALSGAIFSNGIESDHILRLTVAAAAINIVFYTLLFLLLFVPRSRRRRVKHSS